MPIASGSIERLIEADGVCTVYICDGKKVGNDHTRNGVL